VRNPCVRRHRDREAERLEQRLHEQKPRLRRHRGELGAHPASGVGHDERVRRHEQHGTGDQAGDDDGSTYAVG